MRFNNGNQGLIKSVRSAVWMIGMGYLFFTGNWWPGILYLLGISMLIEVVAKVLFAAVSSGSEPLDEQFEAPLPDDAAGNRGQVSAPLPPADNTRMQRLDPEPIPPAKNLPREYRTDLLPPKCPNCGAPIGERDVEMVGVKTAKCGFCGSHFSLQE